MRLVNVMKLSPLYASDTALLLNQNKQRLFLDFFDEFWPFLDRRTASTYGLNP